MTKQQTKTITILSIIIFILAFMVSNRLWFRLDLTRTRAHTISRVSRNLHREIPDYVTITYFLSGRLRSMTPVVREIEDTLREYAAHSRGRIRVVVRDPIRTNQVGIVEQLGLQPRQVQTIDRDQASFITVYSGIVIEYLDRIEVLPWVISTDTLEYDLTSRIRSMVMDLDRRVGVIVGDSFRLWREDFAFFHRLLMDAGYTVRLFSAGEEIPDNLPALFVFGGVEDFDNWDLYIIDRYIQLGGRVLFAVNGVFVDHRGSLEARRQHDMGLLDMLASYGVIVRPEFVLDRTALTLQYQTVLPTGAVQFRIARYPLWISVLEQNGNAQHPITAGFSGLDLYWASPLELHTPGSLAVVPLFTSTSEAWLMREPFVTNPDMAFQFQRDAHATRGEKILGASVTGHFPSFFRGAPKPVREGSDEELPDMPDEASFARIIVIGNTDFATNIIQATGASQNLDFLLRAADWLTSDDDIVTIRSRQSHIGRLDRIMDENRRASAMMFAQVVNLVLVPLSVIAVGLYLSRRRKKRSEVSNGV